MKEYRHVYGKNILGFLKGKIYKSFHIRLFLLDFRNICVSKKKRIRASYIRILCSFGAVKAEITALISVSQCFCTFKSHIFTRIHKIDVIILTIELA